MGYEEKTTQKKRILSELQKGRKITQINLPKYLNLLGYDIEYNNNIIDAIAELGVANLPARIYGLRQDGYSIKSEDVKIKNRYGEKSHYVVYSLEESFNG